MNGIFYVKSQNDSQNITKPEALTVNPIRVAPGLGAGFAAQGFQKAMPFFHAAPGCNFLSKVMLTQHFREPIATAGSDIKETALIFGGTRELQTAIQKFCEKSSPEIVFILSSSIPEIRGEDYSESMAWLEKKFAATKFVVVKTPDFQGGFSEGYAQLIYRAVEDMAQSDGEKIPGQVNFLPAPYMSAGDIDAFVELAESLDLQTIVIPDLSSGPDGSKEKFSSMSPKGTTRDHLHLSGRSMATVTVGASLKPAGDFLQKKHCVEHFHFDSLTGLSASDNLVRQLMKISGKSDAPEKIKKDRARLKDLMIDTHLDLNERYVALALEPDHVTAYKALFEETGIRFFATTNSLYEIEKRILSQPVFDAIIAGTHGKELAEKFNLPLIRSGFAVTDRYGYQYKTLVGYKGAIEVISELANIMAEAR